MKHELANNLYHIATEKNQFFVSLLCLQETAFVLHKLGKKADDIEAMLYNFLSFQFVPYQVSDLIRAIDLAKLIGFNNTNDCIHLSIAETHCTEIYTFNKSDFKRLQNLTKLKITLL
ncbi:type II toxin-antitoxin system VapC family toxin [Dyadobacter subterraneus]|uniref:PIN domain-containing protein n=1 Tax=Dyadobacter subterraneus TaxID=2773304 RepID=A0ABR9W707_9BACT|nr:PIN domain-containing protein [Dyadobacter subterraneus]